MQPQLHLAIQYLATCAISFLPRQEDDSHTNLGFNAKECRFESRILDAQGHFMALQLNDFSLAFIGATHKKLPLEGKTHQEIIKWILEVTTALQSDKVYTYKLHYDLPYGEINEFQFSKSDLNKIEKEIQMRTLAQNVIASFLHASTISGEIRVWPHHFDTGTLASVSNNSDLTIGIGLATPDTLMDDYYFYLSGYQGHEGIDTDQFPPLKHGKWINNSFKGAILSASKVEISTAVTFLNEALNTYLKQKNQNQ